MTRERIVSYCQYPHDSIRVALAETSTPALPMAKTIRKRGAPLLNRHSAYRNDNESSSFPRYPTGRRWSLTVSAFFCSPSLIRYHRSSSSVGRKFARIIPAQVAASPAHSAGFVCRPAAARKSPASNDRQRGGGTFCGLRQLRPRLLR